MQQQTVDIQVVMDRRRKLAFRDALQAALREQPAVWKVVIRSALIYEIPSSGSWWWSITLSSDAAMQHMLLVVPGEQTPELLAEIVGKAVRGDLPTVRCSACQKVRLKNGSWVARALPKGRPNVTHGVCPDCVRRLYPSLPPRPQ